MRSNSIPNTLSDVRNISATLKFTDPRLRFAVQSNADNLTDVYTYDADNYSAGILRIATTQPSGATYATLYYSYMVPGVSATAWTAFGTNIKLNSRPAVYGSRLFFQKDSDGGLYYCDFGGTTFGSQTNIAWDFPAYPIMIAPVSNTEFYAKTVDTTQYSRITMNNTSGTVLSAWWGRSYGALANKNTFDAVRIGSTDHIYYCEDNIRTVCLEHSNTWSEVHYVYPIDAVDSTTSFLFSSANIFNGMPFVTGVMARDSALPYHMYTIGPDKYTAGRDLFIRPESTGSVGGKLHLVGAYLWYIGMGFTFKSDATTIVGYDNATRKFTTTSVIDIKISSQSDAAFSIEIVIPSSITHAAVRSGSNVVVETNVNGDICDINVFTIDNIALEKTTGRTQTIAGRSAALKALTDWQSDASYDYWSQTKVAAYPGLLSDVVEQNGVWTVSGNDIGIKTMNELCTLYSASKSSRNSLMRCKVKFYYYESDASFYASSKAVLCNTWAKETPLDAATRLGVDSTTITDDQLLSTASSIKVSGNGTVVPYVMSGLPQTEFTYSDVPGFESLPKNIPSFALNTWYWIQVLFQDGRAIVYSRPDTSTTWTLLSVMNHRNGAVSPWLANGEGRPALQAMGQTYRATTYGFSDTDDYIPLSTVTKFPTSGTTFTCVGPFPKSVIVDDEVISYSAISADTHITGCLPMPGYPLMDCAAPTSWRAFGDLATRDYVCQPHGLGSNHVCDGFSVWIKKVGSPSDNLVVRQEFVGAFPGQYLQYSKEIPSSEISTSGTKLMVWFGKGYAAGSNDWMVLTRSVSVTHPDNTNYYMLGEDSSNINSQEFNDTNDTFTARTGVSMHAHFTNGAFDNGNFNMVIANAALTIGNSGSNALAGCALYVSSGEMAGTLFRITGSSYIGAAGSYNIASLYVDSDPSGFKWGDTVDIVPCLSGLVRGSTPLSHTDGTAVDLYYGVDNVTFDRFEAYSTEIDMSFEDMATELARKAGILSVKGFNLFPDTIIPSTCTSSFQRRNVIAKLTIPVGFTGTVVLTARSVTSSSDGVSLTISPTSLVYSFGSTIRETLPLPYEPSGNITVSFFDKTISMWQNGALVNSFTMTADDLAFVGYYFRITGTSTNTIGVYVPEGNIRIDNYILDMGQAGATLMQNLINEKHFFYQDTSDGNLRLYNQRPITNNPLYPYTKSISMLAQENDTASTRIRVEGAEINEAFDTDRMVDNGNVFVNMNMNEINNLDDAAYYSNLLLTEAGSQTASYQFVGRADTRLEPGDIYYIDDGGLSVPVIADTIQINLTQGNDNVAFDMNVSGRVPRYLP